MNEELNPQESVDQKKTLFCSQIEAENTHIFGWCVGKVFYKWLAAIITSVTGGATAAWNWDLIIEFLTSMF